MRVEEEITKDIEDAINELKALMDSSEQPNIMDDIHG